MSAPAPMALADPLRQETLPALLERPQPVEAPEPAGQRGELAALSAAVEEARPDVAPPAQAEAALDRLFSGSRARDGGVSGGGADLSAFQLDPGDERFLDEVQHGAFRFFWENTNPANGLTRDRAKNFEDGEDRKIASLAATGFGLIALGIGSERGWITREQAYERARNTLLYFRDVQPNFHGWFYHWLNYDTGAREWRSEVSSIDTALFLMGALFIGEHFHGTEVQSLAEDIYGRVDFEWMRTDGGAKATAMNLSHGWTPEGGFLPNRWDRYSEHMILYLLGLGSPTFPLPQGTWHGWERPRGAYAGIASIASGPLFTHQYSHLGVDFRNKRDAYADYFQNSINATLANRRFCMDNASCYATYGPDSWGLTASDGPDGYRDYGAPPGEAKHDGTVAPTAAGGSIAFTPELSIRALRFMKDTFGDRLWGRYGLADAYNTDPRWSHRFNAPGMWRSPDVIGIDQGAMLLMIENARSGLIWRTLMRSRHIHRGMRVAGFLP